MKFQYGIGIVTESDGNEEKMVMVKTGNNMNVFPLCKLESLEDLGVNEIAVNLLTRLVKTKKGETLEDMVSQMSKALPHMTYDERVNSWVETANMPKGHKWYIAETTHFVIAEHILDAQKSMTSLLFNAGEYALLASWHGANQPLVEVK